MCRIAVLMGSASDEELVRPCLEVLEQLHIPYFVTVTSAHRTPERTEELMRGLEEKGAQIFICAAGMAAHLAGAVAARTLKPVIGIPLAASPLGGMDALLSTVQMPPGFPVATVALDKAGARNAAWLAAQILALSDAEIAERFAAARRDMQTAVLRAAEKIEQAYGPQWNKD